MKRKWRTWMDLLLNTSAETLERALWGCLPFFFYLQLRHRAEPRSISAAPGGREPRAAVPPCWAGCPTMPAQQRAAAGCPTDVPDRALQQQHPGATVPKSTSPAMAMMLLSDAQVPGCQAGGPEDPHLQGKPHSPPVFLFRHSCEPEVWNYRKIFKNLPSSAIYSDRNSFKTGGRWE